MPPKRLRNMPTTVEAFHAEIGLEKLWLAFGQGANPDGYQYITVETILALTKRMESLSSTPVLDVMLFRLSVEQV